MQIVDDPRLTGLSSKVGYPPDAFQGIGEENSLRVIQALPVNGLFIDGKPPNRQSLQQVTAHHTRHAAFGQGWRIDRSRPHIEQVGNTAVGKPLPGIQDKTVVQPMIPRITGSVRIKEKIGRFQTGKRVAGLPTVGKDAEPETLLI